MTPLDNPYLAVVQPLGLLSFAVFIAIPPLAVHVALNPFAYLDPTRPLAVRLKALRERLFFYSWRFTSPVVDKMDAADKQDLIAKAHGTVLEVGPGVGDNIKYYDRAAVSRLILVEPNLNMHAPLKAKAKAAGFDESDGSLLLLSCGAAASDEQTLQSAGIGKESVDSVICIHVLCSIPGPAAAIELYRRLLKPQGYFGFYEHVRSNQKMVADAQAFYTRWIWRDWSDGCCLDRPTGVWIAGGADAAEGRPLANGTELGDTDGKRWQSIHISQPRKQPIFTPLPHVMGWAIKS